MDDDVNKEILEQLRLQREQQRSAATVQMSTAELEIEEKEQEMEIDDGKFLEQPISSPARKRQFPFGEIGNPHFGFPSIHAAVGLSHVVSVLGACPSPAERRRLVSRWGARQVLHSGRIVPSATELRSGYWSHLFYPTPVGTYSNEEDLHGLLHNPAWTRTFDVWPYHNDEPPQIISSGVQDIALRDIHRSLKIPVDSMNVITCRYRALPVDMENPVCMRFEAVSRKSERRDTVRAFQLDYSSPPNPTVEILEGEPHLMINDICYLNTTTILLAPLYRRGPAPSLPVILVLEGDGVPTARPPANTNLLPHSDALCIEADYEGGLACTGFRNGQLVVTDLHGNVQAASALHKDNAETFGSIHTLVRAGEKQMLARGSLGNCRLLDLRKLSSSPKDTESNGCVVTEYKVPNDLSTERLTRKCRGIAMDPSRSTVFSPMVSRDEVPGLAAWSLHTGEYVGSKPLAPHPDSDAGDVIPSTSSWGVSWVELCSRVTAAWEPAGDVHDKAHKVAGKFAVWYKTGMSFPGPSIPNSAGKIHQVVCDGRPSSY